MRGSYPLKWSLMCSHTPHIEHRHEFPRLLANSNEAWRVLLCKNVDVRHFQLNYFDFLDGKKKVGIHGSPKHFDRDKKRIGKRRRRPVPGASASSLLTANTQRTVGQKRKVLRSLVTASVKTDTRCTAEKSPPFAASSACEAEARHSRAGRAQN